jgi:hypothetical protein
MKHRQQKEASRTFSAATTNPRPAVAICRSLSLMTICSRYLIKRAKGESAIWKWRGTPGLANLGEVFNIASI